MGNDKDATQAPTSILEISAFDAEARVNPHPKLKQLRENGRFLRDEGAKTWLLSHYDDIKSTVNDGTFVRQPSKAEEGSLISMLTDPEDPEGRRSSILFQDNPDHARNRQPLMTAFYKRIKQMEQRSRR